MRDVDYILTGEQAKGICDHYGLIFETMYDYEICELLDRLIDDFLYGAK